MEKMISEFIGKLNIKKYLYLQNGSFELYRNIYKAKTNIEKEILNDKLVDVLDSNKVNSEHLHLIASRGNELGWVSVDKPIFIYSTFPEKIIVKNTDSTNIINEKLNLYESIDEKTIYTKRYFILYQDTIYIGITKEGSLISFLPINQVSNGDIDPINFKFKSSRVRLFEDIYKKIHFQFLNNQEIFECEKILNLPGGAIGSFRNGQTRYWFNLTDTNINFENEVKKSEKSLDYYLLEHLFYSQSIEKNSVEKESSPSIEEKVIIERFNEYRNRIEELREENKNLKSLLDEYKQNEKQITE